MHIYHDGEKQAAIIYTGKPNGNVAELKIVDIAGPPGLTEPLFKSFFVN